MFDFYFSNKLRLLEINSFSWKNNLKSHEVQNNLQEIEER